MTAVRLDSRIPATAVRSPAELGDTTRQLVVIVCGLDGEAHPWLDEPNERICELAQPGIDERGAKIGGAHTSTLPRWRPTSCGFGVEQLLL